MNVHPRKPGVIETQPRVQKPRHTTIVPLLESQLEEKWLIFEHRVYYIGNMYSGDYEKMVKSYATTDYLKRILLGKIDYWDSWARWSTCLILLQLGKITLYDSREQAERAMGASV